MTKLLPNQNIFEQWGKQYFKFKAFCDLSWELCNNKDDNITFINGVRGSGKSMTGVAFLRFYLENYLHLDFTKQVMKDHIVYEHDALFQKAKFLPPKHPILVDEGVRVAYTGDFAVKEVKDLIKFFAQCRTKNRFVIFVSPDFFDVAKRLRQYARYRLRMVERGRAVLFARDNSEGVDSFHLEALKDIEKYHDDLTPVEDVIGKIQKHPCFKDTMLVPDVPEYIREWYDEYRDWNVYGDKNLESFGINDRAAMIVHNLKTKWKALSTYPKMTSDIVFDELCINPITGEKIFGNKKIINDTINKILKHKERMDEKFKGEERAKVSLSVYEKHLQSTGATQDNSNDGL